MRSLWILLSGVTAIVVPSAAVAQAAPATSIEATPRTGSAARAIIYEPAFFAAFAPRTALDMVRQVPGFSLDSGNSDVRGLGGSAGNVVFNGARPSTKSERIDTLLDRIPAASVIRIEVSSGDIFGADYAGKARVLNLIVSAQGGIEGSATARIDRLSDGHVIPDLSASAVIKRGHGSVTLSAGTGRFIGRENGYDRVTALPSGRLTEYRRKVNTFNGKDPFVSVAAAIEDGPTKAVRINARIEPQHFVLHQDNRVSPVGGAEHDDNYDDNNRGRVFELGGDVTRPLGGGAIKLVGLATRKHRDNNSLYRRRSVIGGPVTSGFRQQQLADLAETVGRLSWSRSALLGFSVDIGAEVGSNRLSNNGQVYAIGAGGAETRIPLPIEQATVSELRGEAYLLVGRALTPKLRLDVGLRNEWSQLKVRGDARADRSLRFFKPNATLDWQAPGKWHAQAVIRRTVNQLDFFDFVSSAELNQDRVNGGNAELQPQRAWELRGSLEHALLGKGQIRVELGYDRIQKLQDRILTPAGFDAPGNLGTGTRKFVEGSLTAPLGKLWSGLQLKADGRLQQTRVIDPLTQQRRDFSGYYPRWKWSLDVRRDRGAFAYGVYLQDGERTDEFRTDEIQGNYNNKPFATAFIEWRPDGRTTATFGAENLLGTAGIADRLLFDPVRRAGAIQSRDYRFRESHLKLSLVLQRTFGGNKKAKAPAS